MVLLPCAILLAASVSAVLSTSSSTERHHGLATRSLELSTLGARSNLLSRDDSCIPPDPADTVTDRLNTALNSSGPGYVLSLCQNASYLITAPILFAAPNQEISTVGYPTDDLRAILVVNGPVANGAGHTTAIDGTCPNCGGVTLRNIQINGARGGAPPTNGGANIEMGGANSGQLVEFVRSFDPRSWSCLHITEGSLNCNNATVQNNDIGPCGSDAFQEWADGISISCRNAVIRNNVVRGPTDGGIVLFGSPGTLVENNTIQAVNHTLLGGVNMVDVLPWGGDYTGTVVQNNFIYGGFATTPDDDADSKGVNDEDVILKIGIAVGPRTWFGNQFGNNLSFSGIVMNNTFSGAFGYAMAVTSARNFTIQNNVLAGNTSFIGARGPNCTTDETIPTPTPFVVAWINVTDTSAQTDFESIPDGDGLTCILPPDGGDFWPYGGNPTGAGESAGDSSGSAGSGSPSVSGGGSGGLSSGAKAGIAIGVIAAVIGSATAAWFIRKRAVRNAELASAAQLGRMSRY